MNGYAKTTRLFLGNFEFVWATLFEKGKLNREIGMDKFTFDAFVDFCNVWMLRDG